MASIGIDSDIKQSDHYGNYQEPVVKIQQRSKDELLQNESKQELEKVRQSNYSQGLASRLIKNSSSRKEEHHSSMSLHTHQT
mmetsp:Transcript_18717/g.17837  ORF Transcript_18717/g.17837 Transcript_18717/m.17837 type:complete len:82 (+) Transcript_18717:1243-1488(+)